MLIRTFFNDKLCLIDAIKVTCLYTDQAINNSPEIFGPIGSSVITSHFVDEGNVSNLRPSTSFRVAPT